MEISVDGRFTHTFDSSKLSKGLRPSKRNPRNSEFAVECSGAVGKDGVLQSIEQLTRFDTSLISGSFPYPQIFILTNLIIGCNATEIYELSNGVFTLQLTVASGSTWSIVDFYDYVYLSNGNVAVIRDALTKEYSTTTDLPTGMTLCNFNGQVIVGGPDTTV